MTKTDFDNTVSSLYNKFASNKTKNEPIENEFKKLKKHLILVILLAKVTLKEMVHKII